MLNALEVENFKAFGTRQLLPIRPITLLFGGNSAGKSSLIQAILLLRQSLAPTDEMVVPSFYRTADLVVRGPLTDLGSFDSLIYGHDRSRTLSLAVGYTPRQGPARRRVGLSDEEFRLEWNYTQATRATSIRHLSSRLTFRGESISLPVEAERPARTFRQQAGSREATTSTLSAADTQRLFRWAQETMSSEQQLELPGESDQAVLFLSGGIPMELAGFKSGRSISVPDSNIDPSSDLQPFHRRDDALHGWLRAATMGLRSDLGAVSYLGPLRAAPERLNVLTGERIRGIGNSGEKVVDALARDSSLLDEVNRWLQRLEIPYSIDVMPVSDKLVGQAIGEVHCMLLKDARTGVEVSPADVGFGIGQVLPVVVQSIVARHGELCLVEQPEIHLHPALQSRLGEMFAEIATGRRGPRFVLETHSEHLILRLQRLIRVGRLKSEDVCVVHVGGDAANNSRVTEIRLSESGEFLDEWPNGFFEERFDELFGE